jgi:hypothetical protein
LSQYPGIPMVRSAEQMAQDVLKAIDSWSDLGAELTKINKQIQGKPEYKYMYNQTFRPATSQGFGTSVTIGWQEYIEYNGWLYTAEEFNRKFWWAVAWATGAAKQYDLVDSRAMSASMMNTAWGYNGNTLGLFLLDAKNKVGKKWWQCGKFVNDYLQYIGLNTPGGRYYDNDLSTKLNSVNSNVAREWAIAVFDYWHKSSDWINHGHVGIVTKVYEDGSFDMIDSNGDLKKPETIRKIHINGSSALKWFFDPSKLPAWMWLDWWMSTLNTNTTLNAVDQAKKENYLEEAKRWRLGVSDTKAIWDLAAEQGWGDEWRSALNQWLKTNLTDTQIKMMNQSDSAFSSNAIVKEFESAINQMQQLQVALNDTSWVWDMSAIFTFMKTLDPSSVVRESEFNSAAATAWVLNPSAIRQKLEKNVNWQFLTPQQREDFKKIAKQFIKVKASNYQIKYDELLNRYDNYGIDRNLAPTNMADAILSQLWMWTTPSLQQQWRVGLMPTTNTASTWAWSTINVGGYYFPSTF